MTMQTAPDTVSLGGDVIDVSTLNALVTFASRAKEESTVFHPLPQPQVEARSLSRHSSLPAPLVPPSRLDPAHRTLAAPLQRTDSNVSTSSTDSTASSVSGSGANKRKRGQSKVAWSRDEDEIISESVERLGQKWSRIASLPALV